MTHIVITDLDALGALYLPWYVEHDAPWHPLDMTRAAHHPRQLAVADISDAEVRLALRVPSLDATHGWWTHQQRIDTHRRDLQRSLALSAISSPEGPVLRCGCHRVCALWLERAAQFEVRLDVVVDASHADCLPGLRRGPTGT
jgi:hypothetical protein